MSEQRLQAGRRGEVLVVQPEEAPSYWQPVPANGFIEVVVAPDRVSMEHPVGFGTQTVPPGCHVRPHAHDRNEEIIHVLNGKGRAVIDDDEEVPLVKGTTLFLGKNRRHTLINDGDEDISWIWLLVPNGLEDFFRAIGRQRSAGEASPAPFPRPVDVRQIELRTVFAAEPSDLERK